MQFKNGEKRLVIGEKGAVALSSILILSIILLIIGLAMAFSEFTQNNIVYNQNKSTEAFYAAESGVKDAMQKIARNKNYEAVDYCLTMEKNSAKINVARSGGQTEIISQGISGSNDCVSSGSNYKTIRTILDVNTEGKVAIISWQEVSN